MTIPAIGNVVTPGNFLAVSAEGQVALSWAATPLVSGYYVNRSPDGVTYTNLGLTTALSYSDTTGVVGTSYYYQVQATNGAASSVATPAQQAVALNPGETTVANLRLMCQQRSDRIGSDNITAQEWNSMISQSYKELYDILVQKFGDDYFVADPYTWTTAQGTSLYPLPADYYKSYLVEVSLNKSDPNAWITLTQFMRTQQNLYNYPNQYTLYGITNLRYRIDGSNIHIVPMPQGNQTIRMWYAPRPSQLINDTDIVDGVSGWEEYIVADVCIKALAKTEEDVSVFTAQKTGLIRRIEEAAENRNVGDPQIVSDTRRKNFAWSDPGGGDYGAGW